MARSYSALVLTAEPRLPDAETLRSVLEQRFPRLGTLGTVEADEEAGLIGLELDGAPVAIERCAGRMPFDPLGTAIQPERDWDPREAVDKHGAYLRVASRAEGEGEKAARTVAARVVALSGILMRLVDSPAAYVPASGALLSPADGLRATHAVMNEVSPIEAWVTLYALRPPEILAAGEKEKPQGCYTAGLTALLGREIELAPVPVTRRQALDRLYGAVWQVLDGGGAFDDGQELRDSDGNLLARVRLSEGFLRKGVPAFVLVGDEAVVDGKRLRLKPGFGPDVLGHVAPVGDTSAPRTALSRE